MVGTPALSPRHRLWKLDPRPQPMVTPLTCDPALTCSSALILKPRLRQYKSTPPARGPAPPSPEGGDQAAAAAARRCWKRAGAHRGGAEGTVPAAELAPERTGHQSHGDYLDLPVPPHRDRGLHGGQVVPPAPLHPGPLPRASLPRLRPHGWRRLLLALTGN